MSEESRGAKKVAPIDVPLSHPVNTSADQRVRQAHNRPVLIGLAVTVLLALVVIFVLPELVQNTPTDPVPVETVQPLSPKPLESPWQDAQLAKARREAQDILNQILEKQQFLEKKQVVLWAKEDFAKATAAAAEGDTLYRQRNFSESLAAYNAALEGFIALENAIPGIIATAMQSGQAYLEQGEAAQASEHFERVLAIEPEHQGAQQGLLRSQSLNQVLALVEEGGQLLDQNKLNDALAKFVEASELDPEFRPAEQGKTQVQGLIVERDFNQAMSEGYQSLDAGRFADAEKSFAKAAKLRPDDSSAKNALVQVRNQSAAQRLSYSLNAGRSAEADEQWQKAADIYGQVLQRDASVIDARVGQLRAQARADLDNSLERLLSDPMRLATPAVFQNGQRVLRDAKEINSPGPRLQRQIDQLQTAMQRAASPVAVQLISDNQTRVNLFRVGELGSFDNKQLMLKPGNYVAVGVRPGFRDVRVEFQVNGEKSVQPVTIICDEPV